MRNFILLLLLSLVTIFSGCHSGTDRQQSANPGDTTKIRINELTVQITDKPTDAVLYHLRAKYYMYDHQFDMALKDINKAISLNSKEYTYFVTLSDIYLLMGQTENSRDALLKVIASRPDDTQALLKLSKLYLIVKDYQNCYATVKKLLLIDNGVASAYYTRAIGLLEQGDTAHAVGDLLQAVDKDQDFYEAYLELGGLFSIRKDKIAETYLKNALNLRPDSKEALYMLGMYYQETGQYDKSIGTYSYLAKIDSTFRDAPYNIGYIYLVYLNEFTKAVPFFNESIKRDAEYYQAYFNRGYAKELSGDYRGAREDYVKSLKIMVNYDKAVEGLNRLDKINGKR